MFDQFFFIHTTGLVLFQSTEPKDRAQLNKIMTQFIIENRVQQDPIISTTHKYFVNYIRELSIIAIASLPRNINVQNITELLSGICLYFIENFENEIKKCPLNFKISDFQPFGDVYQTQLNALVKSGKLADSQSQVVQTQEIEATENRISSAQSNPEEAKLKIELIKQQMREKANQDRKQKSLQKSQSPKNQRTQSPSKPKPVEDDMSKYSFIEQASESTNQLLLEKTQTIASIPQNNTFSLFSSKTLNSATLDDFMSTFRAQLLNQNISSQTTDSILNSVRQSLQNAKLPTFRSAKNLISETVRQQLIKSINLRPNFVFNQINQAHKKPFIIAIIGINGMGKTTTIGKLLFKIKQANLKGFVCACDSFRSGAVEQVKTHCDRLGMSCYDQGYGKNPSAIAKYGIQQAVNEGSDVVLIDTAGRMHNNSGLMQELCKLISDNQPDLVIYVGEALVGSTGAVQIKEYGQQILEATGRNIDGVILTKYDAIGDKVGAALNFSYESGLPILYVGIGQSYPDLIEIEVDEIVQQIL